jgi:hypothetical protein
MKKKRKKERQREREKDPASSYLIEIFHLSRGGAMNLNEMKHDAFGGELAGRLGVLLLLLFFFFFFFCIGGKRGFFYGNPGV